MLKKLRRIAFASMFALDQDLFRPQPAVDDKEDDGDDEDEYEEDEMSEDEDPGMDIDDSNEADEGMLAPSAEIWFLDNQRAAVGSDQRVMEGEDGRAEHMIHYPVKKRDGWWWNEHHPIPLD